MFKAFAFQPPPRFEIVHEAGDDMCTVVFYAETHTVPTPDGDSAFVSRILSLTVAYKSGLLRDIRDNYSEWLAMAYTDSDEGRENR